jgi:hypothetical protein
MFPNALPFREGAAVNPGAYEAYVVHALNIERA